MVGGLSALRRQCGRRRWCSVLCLCLAALLLVVLACAVLAYMFREKLLDLVTCSDEDSRRFIQEYCQVYEDGLITGSLCEPLCRTARVQFGSCTNFHAGKQVVVMFCDDFCLHGRRVESVLKTSAKNISAIYTRPDMFTSLEDKNFVKFTRDMILESTRFHLGFVPFTWEGAIEFMWESNYERYLDHLSSMNAVFRTIALLMEEDEYKIIKVLESSGVVPRTYGTCGPLYLQESCPPGILETDFSFLLDRKFANPTWSDRSKAAVRLLQLAHRLGTIFQEPLHLCDVKGSNFGICADNTVKVIDVDSVFFETPLMTTFNLSKCRVHDDCNFFDCKGVCDAGLEKCYTTQANNNLQLICQKLLKGSVPRLLDFSGLLAGAPHSVANKMQAVLDDCTAQTGEVSGVAVHKPHMAVLHRMIELLLESQQEL